MSQPLQNDEINFKNHKITKKKKKKALISFSWFSGIVDIWALCFQFFWKAIREACYPMRAKFSPNYMSPEGLSKIMRVCSIERPLSLMVFFPLLCMGGSMFRHNFQLPVLHSASWRADSPAGDEQMVSQMRSLHIPFILGLHYFPKH